MYDWENETCTPEVIVTMPPQMYPMETQVVTKIDLPLLASPNDAKTTKTVPTGTKLVLCSSDDTKWLYVATPVQESGECDYSGYVRLGSSSTFLINGAEVDCSDVFEHLNFAG